tara:strand:- start:137254 stop:137475 length:222 start_codon:yes stop_codon:yes gene_type:complete
MSIYEIERLMVNIAQERTDSQSTGRLSYGIASSNKNKFVTMIMERYELTEDDLYNTNKIDAIVREYKINEILK